LPPVLLVLFCCSPQPQSIPLGPFQLFPKILGDQRWASTLANRSNARHRSNFRAPLLPPFPRCMYPKCGNLCGQRGKKRFIASWGLRMSHICPCTPCPSPPPRSKVESRHFAHLCRRYSQVKMHHRRQIGHRYQRRRRQIGQRCQIMGLISGC
jgi:hypothetical protein